MIRAIIFDFDGVLIESAGIKTEAFRRLFSKWNDKVDEIVRYHIKNMGISRYVKFKYFYENIINEPYSDKIEAELGARFSEIVLAEIKKAPFVNGTKEFLEQDYQKYLLFIASGTPQEELGDIVSFRGLDKYFNGVYGTPATKTEIVEMILKRNYLERNQVVFVGDAESDKMAAGESGIPFILRTTSDNGDIPNLYKIRDLTQLNDIIMEIWK